MSETNDITGGCACRAVRYRLTEPPVTVRVCWCRPCQYIAAGGGTVNLRVQRAALSVEGPLQAWDSIADSGNRIRRSFCSQCGTPVLAESSGAPELAVVRVGTLDEPNRFPPRQNIWTNSAPVWACLDDSLPGTPRQPG